MGDSSWEIDVAAAEARVLKYLAIPGKSGDEKGVADQIRQDLLDAGAEKKMIVTDSAHNRTPIKGNTGNLIFRMRGTHRGAHRMLSSHMDTVPICVGCQPVRKGDLVTSSAKGTGLGADNRAGVATILTAALEILENDLPHPPLTFCWFIQEEIGLQGARHVTKSLLGRPRLAFNWDGGSPTKMTIGATGGYRMEIDIHGVASHAGVAPENGVSAIAIASLAIARLQENGWLGRIEKGNRVGTANVGIIQGGAATNVVTDHVYVKAESRSHNSVFRERITKEIEKAFQGAAKDVKNVAGETGRVEFRGTLDYDSFKLKKSEPCVKAATQAIKSVGAEPAFAIANGGLDANWITKHGIPTVSMGCGQLNQHMTSETLDMAGYRDACRIALKIAATED